MHYIEANGLNNVVNSIVNLHMYMLPIGRKVRNDVTMLVNFFGLKQSTSAGCETHDAMLHLVQDRLLKINSKTLPLSTISIA